MLTRNPDQLLDLLYRTKATLRQCQRELRFGGDDVDSLNITISRAEKWLEEGIEANLKAIDEIISSAVAEVEDENAAAEAQEATKTKSPRPRRI